LGALQFRDKEPEAARKTLQEALTRAPANPLASITLADLELKEGRRSQAVQLLEKSTKAHPENNAVKIALVNAYMQGANRTLDQADLKKALDLSSELLTVEEALNDKQQELKYLHVNALISNGKTEEAWKAVNTYAKEYPEEHAFQLLRQQVIVERQAAPAGESEKKKEKA
jgi:Putative Zn-dependent protease, contains TPR repeats